MILPVMAISNIVLTRQIYSEETNGAHAHYREPVPLKLSTKVDKSHVMPSGSPPGMAADKCIIICKFSDLH